MTRRPVLILGGSSDVGLAVAHRFAKEGYPIVLAGRHTEALERDCTDIALRYRIEAIPVRYDALDLENAESFFDGLPVLPCVVVSAVGLLGDQDEAAADPAEAQRVTVSNFLGPAIALEVAARRLAVLDEQTAVIGISSVAGDRGRAANYWYGASKAALTTMLSGLRQKHSASKLRVVTVIPGYIDTKMIAGVATPTFLTSTAEKVGDRIFANAMSGRLVVYVGGIWWVVMTILRLLPERIFMKLRF